MKKRVHFMTSKGKYCFYVDQKVRPEIIDFAEKMETVMREHDEKKGDSWKKCDVKQLDNKLCEEFREWDETNKCSNEELVDIANMCMMLWNRLENIKRR